MAETMPSLRPRLALPGLLALLLCLVAGPAPASAHHRDGYAAGSDRYAGQAPDDGYGDPGDDDGSGAPDPADDDGTDDGAAPPVPATPPAAPAPAAPTTPPATPPAPVVQQPPLVTTATVAGRVARMRADGRAAIPRGAPARVRAVIAAANQIVGKPYKWGGGHARLIDRGYDCSGAVGYALIRSSLLGAPAVSGTLARYGSAGAGRWVTLYANRGHVYMEVAGLRLDTSPAGDPAGRSGVRWRPLIGGLKGFHVRHPVGL